VTNAFYSAAIIVWLCTVVSDRGIEPRTRGAKAVVGLMIALFFTKNQEITNTSNGLN
jgi:hypothetical protein